MSTPPSLPQSTPYFDQTNSALLDSNAHTSSYLILLLGILGRTHSYQSKTLDLHEDIESVKGRTLSNDEVLTSPWWIAQADFEEISRRASASGSALSDVWRQHGAIARQWGGSCDLVVKAKIVGSLTAFIGPGTIQDMRKDDETASPSDDQPLWVPPPTITQVFIPGLRDKTSDGTTSIVAVALDEISIKQL